VLIDFDPTPAKDILDFCFASSRTAAPVSGSSPGMSILRGSIADDPVLNHQLLLGSTTYTDTSTNLSDKLSEEFPARGLPE
jgi:hypothetical protein